MTTQWYRVRDEEIAQNALRELVGEETELHFSRDRQLATKGHVYNSVTSILFVSFLRRVDVAKPTQEQLDFLKENMMLDSFVLPHDFIDTYFDVYEVE